MRHFIVLGFTTTANSEQGEQVHLGSDRGEAIEIVNATEAPFVRKQLFELTVPHLSRHFSEEDLSEENSSGENSSEEGPTEENSTEETETKGDQPPKFADVPGHDALVAAGIDSFESLAEVMQVENWQKPIAGVGKGIARQISEFLNASS